MFRNHKWISYQFVPTNLLLSISYFSPDCCCLVSTTNYLTYLHAIFHFNKSLSLCFQPQQFIPGPISIGCFSYLPKTFTFQNILLYPSYPQWFSSDNDDPYILHYTRLVLAYQVFKSKTTFRLRQAHCIPSNSSSSSWIFLPMPKITWTRLINFLQYPLR